MYEQLVKSKKKEITLQLIRRDDFIEIIYEQMQLDLLSLADGMLVEVLMQLLQLDSKYSDVFQLKNIQILFEEVLKRHLQEEQELKALENFYNPKHRGSRQQSRDQKPLLERVGELDEEPSGDQMNTSNLAAPGGGEANVEVLNFEQMMDDDDDQGYLN